MLAMIKVNDFSLPTKWQALNTAEPQFNEFTVDCVNLFLNLGFFPSKNQYNKFEGKGPKCLLC